MRSEARPFCCCCGSSGISLYEELRDNLFAAPGAWSLKRCEKPGCGLVWLDPMPIAEDLSLAYKDYYTHGDVNSKSFLFRYLKIIYRCMADGLLMIGGIPAEKKRAALMFLGDRTPGDLLDVGCGHGDFLGMMAKRGWSVMGVDFDAEAVAAARRTHNIDVRVGTVDTMIDMKLKFDVVTATNVIEHVPDPMEFLSKCRSLLRQGGRMVLRTPNVASLGHRRYGRHWRGLEPPRHLHLFTVPALERAAGDAGFAQANCFTSSVAAEFMLTASRILERKDRYPPVSLTILEHLEFKLLAPLLGLSAKIAWLLDRSSGEEVCAILTNTRERG
jgi:SAM-dependent methyltransferase